MESNLTAVELLVNELQIRLLKIKSEPDGIVRETMINNFLIDTEQAKEMEKQQLQLAYASRCSFFSCENNSEEELANCTCGKHYYNETFNK
jgi:hypothetical protein